MKMSINPTGTTQITIRKNQGITQALKDLVEKNNLKMSDGSISKTEWEETIKTLDKIQKSRMENGGKSIFGDNYSVKEGQKIDFTKDEIQMLYDAMGIEFGKDSIKPKQPADKKDPVGIGKRIPDPKDKKPPVNNKPKPPVGKETKPKPLTAKESSEARHYGDNVSDYLVGYTDDSEKGLTKEVITKNVNHRNVLEFLAGYEQNKGGMGDHFFTQLNSEYGFEEKQNLMKDVASKLSKFLKNNNQPKLAREIDVALQDHGLSAKEVKKLDEIVQTMLTDVPGLKL